MDGAAAFRAILRHAKRPPARAFFSNLQHMGDHFPRSLDQHRVADLRTPPLDLVHVVEGGAADSDAADLHWLQHRHRRERAGTPDLHANIVDHRGFLPRWIFVGDGPARGLCRVPQFSLYPYGIHLDHHAIDLVGQLLAFRFPGVAILENLLHAVATFPILERAEA